MAVSATFMFIHAMKASNCGGLPLYAQSLGLYEVAIVVRTRP